ncbi:TonB-dependent receptor plug domain-containing protein [Thiorhodovibrio winogradskyi]|nr:TonB-dependent receptor [Thiorhodovibrio winogradskyi]
MPGNALADVATPADPSSLSQAGSAPGSLESEILDVLADATEIATKSRLNADYVPGIVTILRREEMLALGVRTVAEALTLVPGVDVGRRAKGTFSASIRGLDHGTTEIKVLIDSVPQNIGGAGSASFFELPITQVERIEVIRGPGSALYGEFAFAGLINIVTSKRPGLHLRYGANDTREVGAIYRFDAPERDLSVRLNLAGWDSRGTNQWVESDALHRIGLAAVSKAPGRVDSGEYYRFGQLKVEFGDASLIAQVQSNRKNPFFGIDGVLPDLSASDYSSNVDEWLIQGRVDFAPGTDLAGAVILHWHQRETHMDLRILPPGASVSLRSPVLPDGLNAERYIASMRAQAETFLEWTGWEHHRWRLELSLAVDKIDDAWRAYNADILTFEQLPEMYRYGAEFAPLEPDARRTIASLAIQDQWSLHPRLDLILGARYDHYTDLSDSFSPRLAGVWRLNDQHLIKAQVAGAFFPPSLLQRYHIRLPPPPEEQERPEDPQRAQTTELGYIFRGPDMVARLTLYHSRLFDVILVAPDGIDNRGEESLQGVELEWEKEFGHAFRLVTNLSYADTLNKETDGPIPGAAKWLGNLSLFYHPRGNWAFTGRWRYVGERARDPLDARTEPLRGYNDLSLALSWFSPSVKGLTLRAGVTNLLNESIVLPAPMDTYENDYPLADSRALWAQISYALP